MERYKGKKGEILYEVLGDRDSVSSVTISHFPLSSESDTHIQMSLMMTRKVFSNVINNIIPNANSLSLVRDSLALSLDKKRSVIKSLNDNKIVFRIFLENGKVFASLHITKM